MASQLNSEIGDLKIYFVIFSKYKNEESCSEDMWDAYIKCQENEMNPQWITEMECIKLEPTKTDVFVFEEFDGEAFKKLETAKCLVVGPRCLLRCFLTAQPIPPGTSPVFVSAMKDMVICASGFDAKIKQDIKTKVEYMGGIFMKQLRGSITHLVSDSVMSAKYEKATECKIPVYTYEWIQAVWKENLLVFIDANDPSFDKYKCQPFMNLIVTSTNLSKRQREMVKKLINENGGEFMGPLDGTKVKVVLAPDGSAMSEKIKYALQNNIPCVKFEWAAKSVDAGYALPFNDYLVTPKAKALCSTPERSCTPGLQPSLDFSTISNIPNDNNRNYVEESMSSTATIPRESINDQSIAPYISIIERLDVREAKLAGPFLDGCSVYVTGFQSHHREKINKILNVGSATRFDDISDALTHVLVGDQTKALNELKIMQSKGINPHILKIDWLLESIKLKKPAPEESYIIHNKTEIANTKKIEPQSPLSKRSLQMLQKPKRAPIPQFNIDNQTNLSDDNEPDIVQQYLQKSNANPNKSIKNQSHNTLVSRREEKSASQVSSISSQELHEKQLRQPSSTIPETTNNSEVPLSQSCTVSDVFNGLTFIVKGFLDEDNSQIIENIEGLGGKVVTGSFSGIPDYGIVPLIGAQLRHTVDEIVTNLFIEDCIDNEKVVDIAYYHRPLSIPNDAKPLADCVIAMSSYNGVERLYLTQLAIALGALHQDSFARRTNIEKKQYAGTHLVCSAPMGQKYNAAVKWNLPAVTADWLIACAEKLKLVDENPYLVGETVAPIRATNDEASLKMGPPTIPSSRRILTPKRHLPQTPEVETPVINKRLSRFQNNTPNSPFHVSTPDSPLGQFIKPNPSPETRKCWAKWLDNFPDKVEPPAKRRAPSTPLSELRRQLWSAMKKPLDGETSQLGSNELETNDCDNSSSDQNNEKTDETDTRVNRVLFTEDDNSNEKSPLNEQLERMEEILRATNSTETRYSLHGDNAKIYEEPRDHINGLMIPSTQRESVCWEDPERITKDTQDKVLCDINEEEVTEVQPQKRKFMLSGLRDRSNYEEIIKQLGGEVSSDPNFDSTATHLLCIKPSRNEKMLGSIAAGKWVLHCSYLRDCERANEFIDEEKYEWGNPKSIDNIPNIETEPEKSLAAAAYRWRIKLRENKKCAFDGMVAMLMVPNDKRDQLERLIRAGNGTVVEAKPPYDTSPNGKKVTHSFIQINKIEQPVDWAMLASKGIWCHLPPYLSQHLTAVEPLNPRDHVIPEFRKYLTLMPK